jgi:hypothetical protein
MDISVLEMCYLNKDGLQKVWKELVAQLTSDV